MYEIFISSFTYVPFNKKTELRCISEFKIQKYRCGAASTEIAICVSICNVEQY